MRRITSKFPLFLLVTVVAVAIMAPTASASKCGIDNDQASSFCTSLRQKRPVSDGHVVAKLQVRLSDANATQSGSIRLVLRNRKGKVVYRNTVRREAMSDGSRLRLGVVNAPKGRAVATFTADNQTSRLHIKVVG